MKMRKITDILFGEDSNIKTGYTVSTPARQNLNRNNLYNNALQFARNFLSNYNIGAQLEIKFNTIRNAGYHEGSLNSGEVELELGIKTISNVKVKGSLIIPIIEGDFVEPSTIMINGNQRILAQSTFDDIIKRNVFSRYLSRRPDEVVSKEMLKFFQNTKVPYVDFGMYGNE